MADETVPPQRTASIATADLVAIVDPGTLRVLGHGVGDGVVTASGLVSGRRAVLWSQDPAHKGGSLGRAGGELVVRAIETADEARIPVIGLLASGDARIQVGAAALDGGAYSPALGDLVITLGPTARMFLTGPRVVRQAIGEEVSAANLGGARAHARNGVSHLDPTDLTSAAALVRDALAHLPAAAGSPRCADARAGRNPATPARWRRRWRARSTTCETWSPDSSTAVSCLSSRRARAPNIVTGFGRLDGWPVGVIANQPQFLGGTLDVHACEKGAWFIDLCGRFGLPLAVPVDTPGFLPGSRQERDGVIRHGATHVRHSRAPASRARPS